MLPFITQTTSASSAIVGVVNTSRKKTKNPDEDWKDFLHIPHDTYWTYWQLIAKKQVCVRSVETEHKKKIKDANNRDITPSPKHKNITPPLKNKRVALTSSSILSSSQDELPSTSTTNSIEIDSNKAEENVDAKSFSSELLKTDDDISTENLSKLSVVEKSLQSRNYSGKKKTKSNHATKKQAMEQIESD
ncbi:22036_t:CDS:2, partial [Dentiscutata erythropus]